MAADGRIAEFLIFNLFALLVGKERAVLWRPRVIPYIMLALLVVVVLALIGVVFVVVQ